MILLWELYCYLCGCLCFYMLKRGKGKIYNWLQDQYNASMM